MNTLQREAEMRKLAKLIEKRLQKMYGEKMGFFLCTGPFNAKGATADYISNALRETSIEWMVETAERLTDKQDIPVIPHAKVQ